MTKRLIAPSLFLILSFLGIVWATLRANDPLPQTATPQPETAVPAIARLVNEGCTLFNLEYHGQDIHLICVGGTAEPTPTTPPTETATHEHPTDTPTATNTAVLTDTPTPPTSTPNAPTEPYAAAPLCPPEAHDNRAWHGLWSAELGCHYSHQHGANPHELDYIFGTDFYTWAGGEISFPWQTFTGAGDNHEHPGTEACMENDCKHQGNRWVTVVDYPCHVNVPGILDGANNCIVAARVQFHYHATQVDALVRFHSFYGEYMVCNVGQTGPENCGIYRGGGHLDLGRLNIPRGFYIPLPNDPDVFATDGRPPEREPYRIHCPLDTGIFCLGSWQSEGNHTYVVTDQPILSAGYGVHFPDEWGPVDPTMQGNPQSPENVAATTFYCLGEPGCKFNSSEMNVFRLWVTIPVSLDNSQWDSNTAVGYFSFSGYTDRYGSPVVGCTAPGLDCVPTSAESVPTRISRLRVNLNDELNTDYDYYWNPSTGQMCANGDEVGCQSVDWITYP